MADPGLNNNGLYPIPRATIMPSHEPIWYAVRGIVKKNLRNDYSRVTPKALRTAPQWTRSRVSGQVKG
jgi:hypothetical protein